MRHRNTLTVIAALTSALALALPVSAGAVKASPIYRGVSYGPSPGELQTIYSQAPGAHAPIVVLVHGGGWRLQKLPTEQGSAAKSLQLKGYAVFDINYDQDSPTTLAFPLESDEVKAAVEWAISSAAAYGGDASDVTLLGGSAGGLLAALAGEQLDAQAPGTVRAVVSLSGPMNFTTLVPLAASGRIRDKNYVFSIGQALGCTGALQTCSTSYEQEWSPALQIPLSGCPNWLLFASEADEAAVSQASEMLADLAGAGCSATMETLPTGHGFSYWPLVSARVAAFVRAQ